MHQISAPLSELGIDQNSQITLGFLVFEGFPMACLTSVIEPLRAANEIAGRDVFRWQVISETGESTSSSAQIPFQADLALCDVQRLDMLFLLSEPDGKFANPHASNGRLRFLARHGTCVSAVSGGIFPLARSGLLDRQTCSVHWCYRTAFEAEFPELETTDDVIVLGKNCCTASGAAAAFDLSLHLVELAFGEAAMTEVACWFQHPSIRSPGVRQKTPAFQTDDVADHMPDMVSKAIQLFSDNLEFPLTTREVARRVGVSARHLERSFRQATGQSPGGYYRLVRLRAARQLVIYTQDPLTSIAHAVGYTNPTSMSRNYVEHFGSSPRQDRQDHNRFRVRRDTHLN
ncbi:GlxA family transcriptional regulator [Ruegeria arenilitoris]|uniref:GlxA family transcriptional regulator n=1 Tax=Ruegeria arenilitoris TaxID=1173585 RepID=UPI0020C43958|nr:helix-turn-helix domain-containing protein [Ruegeria arenilitoris]